MYGIAAYFGGQSAGLAAVVFRLVKNGFQFFLPGKVDNTLQVRRGGVFALIFNCHHFQTVIVGIIA
mgnify:CR=1 FL=1